MKICLVGAPGAGKSAVAKKVASLYKAQGVDDWAIADDYVEKLKTQTGIPFGHPSTFPQNLAVATQRMVAEEALLNKGKNVITCGSIYETCYYTFLSLMFTPVNEAHLLNQQQINQIITNTFALLERVTWSYDALFLLPYSNPDPDPEDWPGVIDAKLPEVLESFNRQAIVLDQKTHKAKAERIIEVVKAIEGYYEQLEKHREVTTAQDQ